MFDFAIVGAGVAGSILADRLSAAGKRVLLLEAGPYVPERDMTTDDLAMTARLYKASGLQAANEDEDLARTTGNVTVLQGACVGGGATVNNAICFQLPEARLKAWVDVGFPIPPEKLRTAYSAIARELQIKPVSEATAFFNPAGQFLSALGPVQVPQVDQPPTAGMYECLVNLAGGANPCQGLGLCNSGCGSERKINAMQVHLPRALATDRCELVADADVQEVRVSQGKVTGLVVDIGGTRREVVAEQYILAAGAVGSSALLLKSPSARGLLDKVKAPVGRRFSANVGSPLFARFSRVIHARPSLQISHYYLPPQGSGFIIESWFAPPGTLAVAMPGFLGAHWERMMCYRSLVTAAPLVDTQPRGAIHVKDGETRIRLPLDPQDELVRIRDGAVTLARAFLQGGGPDLREVVLGTREGFVVREEADLQRFAQVVKAPHQLRLGTGHPQGGNAMSDDPAIGVVDGSFRVRGVANLRICDASVFPDVAGVNPQWTVMALAHICGDQLCS